MTDKVLYCSFCCKSQHEVVCLIAGPAVFICDECIGHCVDILAEKDAAKIEYESWFPIKGERA